MSKNGLTESVDGNNNHVATGAPYIDVVKLKKGAKIEYDFRHALSAINVTIDAAVDATTPGTAVDADTKIFIRSVSFEGLATKGALNLNSTAANGPLWTDYSGAGVPLSEVLTVYDGRRDGKEGVEGAVASNETPLGLNPVLIQDKSIRFVDSSAGKSREEMLTLVASMWESVGVHTTLKPMDENDFIALRKQGLAPCYCSTWSADFNDPDNFIYTFFGNEENTRARSLCYGDSAVMERVHSARAIAEEDARLAEYRALEQKIVREDAAWIPLYSAQHYFAVSDRVEGFKVSWNGWSSNRYQDVALREG